MRHLRLLKVENSYSRKDRISHINRSVMFLGSTKTKLENQIAKMNYDSQITTVFSK